MVCHRHAIYPSCDLPLSQDDMRPQLFQLDSCQTLD